MNDFLTGREADSAGSLPWAAVRGPAFPELNTNLPRAAGSGEGRASSSVGRATAQSWRFSSPTAFSACPGWAVGEGARPSWPLSSPSSCPLLPTVLLLGGLLSAAQLHCLPLACAAFSRIVSLAGGRRLLPKTPQLSRPSAARRLLGVSGCQGGRGLSSEETREAEVRQDSAIPCVLAPQRIL